MQNHWATPILESWGIPEVGQLERQLRRMADSEPAARHAIDALTSGKFVDRQSRSEPLDGIQNPIPQVALLAWLAQSCPSELSIEIGFGMGMTASVILAARAAGGRPYSHLIYDPYGLAGGRGAVVEQFLREEFEDAFQRLRVRSQFGIGDLAIAADGAKCGFVFVDGDHSYEGVMADFFAVDKLLMVGGYIVFDDAAFPAVETVVNFLRSNRKDYEVSNLEIPNTAVLKRTDIDRRPWDHFIPFEVPQRSGWTHVGQKGKDLRR